MSLIEHGYAGWSQECTPGGVYSERCRCGARFVGGSNGSPAEQLRKHLDEMAAKPSSVRVVLAHTTDPATGLRETVAVGPLMTTAGVMAARHVLEGSGAECEVVTLASVAQWCRAHGWSDVPADVLRREGGFR